MTMQAVKMIRVLTLMVCVAMLWFLISFFFFPTKSVLEDPFYMRCIEGSIAFFYVILAASPYRFVKNGFFRRLFFICLAPISIFLAVIFVWLSMSIISGDATGWYKGIFVLPFAVIITFNIGAFLEITEKR